MSSEATDRGTEPKLPWWRWVILLTGWGSVLVLASTPLAMKGGPEKLQIAIIVAAGTCIAGAVFYTVRRRLLFSRYSQNDVRWVFTPMILGAVIVVGVILAIMVAAKLAQ